MSTAITKAEPQGLQTAEEWSRERVDLIKKTLCPKGITDGAFSLFIEQCRVRGLNPLAGEAFCVERRTNVGTREKPEWSTSHVLQTSVAGMRARAERHMDLEVFKGAAIFEKDTCVIDMDAGTVSHRFDAAKPRGAFVGAWALAKRRGLAPVVVHLLPGSRRADGPVYANNPSEHLRKCSLAAALREAYPTAFSGVYSAEEMPEERAPTRVQAALEGHVTVEAHEPPALPPGPTVIFGEWKHRPVAHLEASEAVAAVQWADEKLSKASPKAKWVPELRANRDAIAAAHGLEAPKEGAMVDGDYSPSSEERAAILAAEMEAARE